MKERPILFSGPMVRAILAGTKTQTRRIVKPQPGVGFSQARRPYGAAGDQLWVRETLRLRDSGERSEAWTYDADAAEVQLPHGDPRIPAMLSWAHHKEGSTCVSIHMPRWASRISLEIVSVRVERLQDVTEEDARAEGARPFFETFSSIGRDQRITSGERAADAEHRAGFAVLWDEINGDRALWVSNPWVWRVEFKRLP